MISLRAHQLHGNLSRQHETLGDLHGAPNREQILIYGDEMKKIVVILMVCIFGGCAQLEHLNQAMKESTAKQRLEVYNASLDRVLVDGFIDISADGMTLALKPPLKKGVYRLKTFATSMLSIEKDMFSEGNKEDMNYTMSRYSYDSESDDIARMYVNMATKRGNTVKLYKPFMTKRINAIYAKPFNHMEQTIEWYDKDNTLIEFDRAGRPVSLLVRAHQAFAGIGVSSAQYASIYFGKGNLRILENTISNSVFQDNFIRQLK